MSLQNAHQRTVEAARGSSNSRHEGNIIGGTNFIIRSLRSLILCVWEREVGLGVEGVDATLVSNTLRYISLANLSRGWGVVAITNGPVCMRRYIMC
jgi:hypothetical protein